MKALVINGKAPAGILEKSPGGYIFYYLPEYLNSGAATPIAHTLPLQTAEFRSEELFPFFQNLVSEGWLLEIQSRTQKIDKTDCFRLLLNNGEDLSGMVSIKPLEDLAK
jgi:serine/threonine-protein kinase HipA